MGLLDFLQPVSFETAQKINVCVAVGLCSIGLFSETPLLWYQNFVKAYCLWVGGSLGTAGIFQLIARQVGTVIQTGPNARKESVVGEIKETLYGFGLTTAALSATPMTLVDMGHTIAFRATLTECLPGVPVSLSSIYPIAVVLYLAKAFIGMVVADCFNYWKHRCFHHRLLWSFHKTHHSHHNPTAFAGFSISPIYALATFGPLALFSYPQLALYLPLHWPILAFYMILNHYLHCGYTIHSIEKVFRPLYIMTSGWHNAHHEKGRMGWDYKPQTFGEMSTIWDIWMGTHADGVYLYAGTKKFENSKNVD